jgi:hypothetical protein
LPEVIGVFVRHDAQKKRNVGVKKNVLGHAEDEDVKGVGIFNVGDFKFRRTRGQLGFLLGA